jgi:protein SCO1/2
MTRRLGLIVAAAVALPLAATACGGSGQSSSMQGTSSPYHGFTVPAIRAPNFVLHDQAGHAVSLASERGRFVIVPFLYVHCKDVCPLIAENLNEALQQLGSLRKDVRVLAVSVDPKGDTPAAVRHFVAVHRLLPQFRYLTGTVAQDKRVWAAYHIASDPEHGSTAVDHTAYEVLIDPKGVERVGYDAQVKAADVVHDIRLLAARQKG